MKTNKKSFWAVVIVFVVCMAVSIFITVKRTSGILTDNYENDQRIISSLISNVVDNTFLRPLTVAETVSKDVITREILTKWSEEEALDIEEYSSEYLTSIRDGFGYSMVFAVSDRSGAYFTPNGISKFLDIENDEHDIWYKTFLETGKDYDLDVDTDEAAQWTLSVFVNKAVYDDRNAFIGVCGVGVNIEELQHLLEKYERIYGVKIDLVDETGLIQVDTDINRIEKDYIEFANLTDYSDGECYYEISKDGSRTVTYMENLDWYLIVQDTDAANSNMYTIIRPSIITLIIGILLIIIIFIADAVKDGLKKSNLLTK